jgi:hypothetical protein
MEIVREGQLYLLRCRFDFINRPTWASQWDKSGPNDTDMACYQNKNGLLRAAIEGKDFFSKKIKILAQCEGQDFCNFEWAATVAASAGATGKIEATNVGLVLVTRYERLTIYKTGKAQIEMRSEEDQKMHLAGYGK